jgi:hypothetical protein
MKFTNLQFVWVLESFTAVAGKLDATSKDSAEIS